MGCVKARISYTYPPDGIRTSKTVNGAVTKFHTMNSTLLGQTKGSDTIVFLYDEKANRYGFDYNGTKYYYIFNVQGDVIGILNQSGTQIVSYQYDPWGKGLSVDGSEASTIGQINPIRYRGYYYDTETGFYYLQSRYYDPTIRRFLNTDSVFNNDDSILGANLYVYCYNSPLGAIDPSGLQPQWSQAITSAAKGTHAYKVFLYVTQNGLFPELFYLAGFIRDYNGIYHTRQDALQQYGGYNDFYDFVFNLASSMASEKFPFSYNGRQYMIWAWKGDYLNLGAGAELGIYYGGGPHWLTDTSLGIGIGLYLSYKGHEIISYEPDIPEWWITGFNPYYQNVLAHDLTAQFTIVFPSQGMFDAFWNTWKHDPRWFTFQHIDAHFIF